MVRPCSIRVQGAAERAMRPRGVTPWCTSSFLSGEPIHSRCLSPGCSRAAPRPCFCAQLCAAHLFHLGFILAAQLHVSRRFLVLSAVVGLAYFCPHLLFRHITGRVSPTPDSCESGSACSPRALAPGGAFLAWLGRGHPAGSLRASLAWGRMPSPRPLPAHEEQKSCSAAFTVGASVGRLCCGAVSWGGRHRTDVCMESRSQCARRRWVPAAQTSACPTPWSVSHLAGLCQAPACSSTGHGQVRVSSGHLPVLRGLLWVESESACT